MFLQNTTKNMNKFSFIYLLQMYWQVLPRNFVPHTLFNCCVYLSTHRLLHRVFSSISILNVNVLFWYGFLRCFFLLRFRFSFPSLNLDFWYSLIKLFHGQATLSHQNKKKIALDSECFCFRHWIFIKILHITHKSTHIYFAMEWLFFSF